LGTLMGQGYRHRETPGGYLHVLDEDADIASFLRRQPDFVRLDVDMHVLPYNIGDWEGLDQFQAYLGGMTANLVPFGIEMMQGGPLAAKLFGLNYAVGRQPLRAAQVEVFHGASGLNVYRNAEAFPRVWTVHQLSSINSHDLISRLASADLRREVVLTGPGPKVDECGKGDEVKLLRREATHIAIEARMACKGMVIL